MSLPDGHGPGRPNVAVKGRGPFWLRPFVRAVLPWIVMVPAAYLLGTMVVAPMMVSAAGLGNRHLIVTSAPTNALKIAKESAVQVAPAGPARRAPEQAVASRTTESATEVAPHGRLHAYRRRDRTGAPYGTRHAHRHHSRHSAQAAATDRGAAYDNNTAGSAGREPRTDAAPDRGTPIDPSGTGNGTN